MTVSELASSTGLPRRTVAVTVANASRRRAQSTRSTSPWRHVQRVAHGIYTYNTDPRPTSENATGWTEVDRDGDCIILRSPDAHLYVATRVGSALRDTPTKDA